MQEEKDFILRQTKLLAEGLGAFLKDGSVDEIMNLEGEKQADNKDRDYSYQEHKEALDEKVAAEIEKFSKEERQVEEEQTELTE